MTRRISIGALLLLVVMTSACKRGISSAGKLKFERAPVIIISIDTLRADHLPAYGYTGVATPAIDALRSDSILFTNAYSHCPLTLPSHVSLLTGTVPADNGVRNNLGYVFDPTKRVTIQSALKAMGYATGAAVSSYVLRRSTGISAGFDSYDDELEVRDRKSVGQLQRSGLSTVSVAEKWISGQGETPFFYFLHLFEPHSPYDPPEPYKSRHAGAPYDGEIAAVDESVGRFLDALKASGVYDRATIFLLSDHGEGLGDHGESEHGIFLYREAIHVPLMVKLPKSKLAGETVAAAVQLMDVFPTIAQLTGVAPPSGLAGQSLLAVAAAKNPQSRRIFSETLYPRIHLGWSDLRSLIDGDHHLIEAPRPELYDLKADPAEKRNVLTENRRTYVAFRKELDGYRRDVSAPANIDPEEAAKMAALGYLGSVATPQAGTDLPDPKDHIAELEAIGRAARLRDERRFDEAIALLQQTLQKNPRLSDGWTQLAKTFEDAHRYDEAIAAYKKTIEVAPSLAPGTAMSLATLFLKLGRLEESRAHAELALKTNPAPAQLLLGRVALARSDVAAAEQHGRAAMNDPTHRPAAQVLLAQLLVAQKRLPDAAALIEQARQEVESKKLEPVPLLEFVRGDLFARAGRFAEAERAFLQEIKSFPDDREAYTSLAAIYILQRRPDAAERVLKGMVQINPQRSSYVMAAQTFAKLGDSARAAEWTRRSQQVSQ